MLTSCGQILIILKENLRATLSQVLLHVGSLIAIKLILKGVVVLNGDACSIHVYNQVENSDPFTHLSQRAGRQVKRSLFELQSEAMWPLNLTCLLFIDRVFLLNGLLW